MGTASDGSEETRTGLSPLAQLPIAPSGTGPVGTTGCQQVQSPMALTEKGRALPVQSPTALAEDEENQFMREILLGEALYRGDRATYETVVQTPDSGLETLWRDFLERDAQSSCSFLEKIGLFGDAPDDPPPEEEDWEEEKAFLPDLAVT